MGIPLLFANLLIEKYLTKDDFESCHNEVFLDLLDFINANA
jgi:hypothetical protein